MLDYHFLAISLEMMGKAIAVWDIEDLGVGVARRRHRAFR
jgi:hypothetical protein